VDVTVVLLASAAVAAGGMACRALFKRRARARRERGRGGLPRIDDVPSGQVVTMTGRAQRHRETVEAPLSEKTCLAWSVTVEELLATPHRNEWSVILEASEAADLRVEDGSGRALVRGADATLKLTPDEDYDTESFDDRAAMELFLALHGQQTTGVLGLERRLRVHEGVLSPGDEVVVRGSGVWEVDPDPAPMGARGGYRTAARRLLMEAKHGEELLLSDDPAGLPPDDETGKS